MLSGNSGHAVPPARPYRRPLLRGDCRQLRKTARAEALLVDLFNEALTLSQIHREAYDSLVIRAISDKFIEGSFVGKSITDATVEERDDGTWLAILLMDI